MAYKCPRCGDPVQRGTSGAAAAGGGAAGALLAAAFGSFQCKNCGAIPRREFSPADRRSMTLGSVGLVFAALVLIGVVIVVIVLVNQ